MQDNDSGSSLVRVSGAGEVVRGQAQVVQVTPRVNVSASPGTKVMTTTHGGKVTFHVTANAPPQTAASNGQQSANPSAQTIPGGGKKPPPPVRTSQSGTAGVAPPVPPNKPPGAPPVPPNKPVVPPKKDLVSRVATDPVGAAASPISVEVKPQKVGPQTLKFGITISKAAGQPPSTPSLPPVASCGGGGGGGSEAVPAEATPGMGATTNPRREIGQVGGGDDEGTIINAPEVHECVDSLSPELEHFHQLLISMAGNLLLCHKANIFSFFLSLGFLFAL